MTPWYLIAVSHIRRLVYRLGFRPKFRTLLYSPSLAMIYGFRDAKPHKAFSEGLKKGRFIK